MGREVGYAGKAERRVTVGGREEEIVANGEITGNGRERGGIRDGGGDEGEEVELERG